MDRYGDCEVTIIGGYNVQIEVREERTVSQRLHIRVAVPPAPSTF